MVRGARQFLMCAGCAFVYLLLLFVTMALTRVAMQDRRLVVRGCAGRRRGGRASASSVLVGRASRGTDEAGQPLALTWRLMPWRRRRAAWGRAWW